MLRLEALQHLHLLLILARRLTHLLLALIIHHLLDHAPRLAIQIAEFAVLGRDLRDVDLGRRGDDMGPPFHLVDLVEMDGDFFAGVRQRFERPGGFVGVDFFGEVALGEKGGFLAVRGSGSWRLVAYFDDGCLAFDAGLQFLFC